jgi:hypothetical protein
VYSPNTSTTKGVTISYKFLGKLPLMTVSNEMLTTCLIKFSLNIPVNIGLLLISTVVMPNALVKLPVIPAVATLKTSAFKVSELKKL